MMTTNRNENLKKGVIDGLQAVGHGLGMYNTKPAIRKTVNKNIQLVDRIVQLALTPNSAEGKKNIKNIEMASLGAIALYTFFRGIDRKKKSLIIQGTFLSAALAVVALTSSKWGTKVVNKAVPKLLDKERYIFDIYTAEGTKMVEVENTGESYTAKINGKDTGTLWRDMDKNPEWNSPNEALKPYMKEIAHHLSLMFSKTEFPAILKGTYPEIAEINWKGKDKLEVLVTSDTNLEVFTTFLQDEVQNLVDFDERLDLLVRKSDEPSSILVGIN